jgi:hypothetical protein
MRSDEFFNDGSANTAAATRDDCGRFQMSMGFCRVNVSRVSAGTLTF